MSEIVIRRLGAGEAGERLAELGAILIDAVAHGASVHFMAGLAPEAAQGFWRGQLPGLASGERQLLVADAGGRLVGTVLVMFAPQPNGVHRAEIGKMLVHSTLRRRGLGRRLLAAAEAVALAERRTLLLLDTEGGSAGEALYRHCGWIEYGRVPDHAFKTDGRLAETVMFYKALAPHRR